jgi:DNA-binding CsgD family transcriptional regulator
MVICHQDALSDQRPCLLAGQVGAQVRTTSDRIPDMVISDSAVVVISADQAAKPVRIEQPALVSILTVIFDQAWNAANPLDRTAQSPPLGIDRELLEAERNLLKLLADGATDESAARHLGISLRTARRHMATLMNALSATSRFQAGAEAAKRGWLG